MSFTNEDVARIAHEAGRTLADVLGADPGPPWASLGDDRRDQLTALAQIGRHGATAEVLHAERVKDDPELAPFDQLSPGDQAKDYLFVGVCVAMNQAAEIKDRAENADRAQKDAVANALGVSPQAAAVRMPFGGAAPVVVQAAAQEPERADG